MNATNIVIAEGRAMACYEGERRRRNQPSFGAALRVCAAPASRAVLALAALTLAAGAADLQPNSPEALITAGHYKRARAGVEPMARSAPNDPKLAYLMSKILAAFGDYERSLKEAQKAAAAEPRNADYRLRLGVAYGQLAEHSGLLQKLGLAKQCKRETDAAVEIDGANLPALMVAAEFNWRATAIVGGDRKRAVELADRIQKLDPRQGFLIRVRFAQIDNDGAGAEKHCRQALAVDPGNYGTLVQLAGMLNGKEAETLAQSAVARDASRAEGYAELARVYAEEGRLAELDALLTKAELAVPDNLLPYYSAAAMLVKRGVEGPRAVRYVDRYLSQEPEGLAPAQAEARKLLAAARKIH